MKNNINILLACLVVLGMAACDTAGGIDSFSDVTEGALASWVTAPTGDLRLSDATSSVSFEVEFIDANDGNEVESFSVIADDGTNSGAVFTSTTFTANANGLQGVAGSFDMGDIYTALGTTAASYKADDEFTITTTVTKGGTVYESGLANQLYDAATDVVAIPDEVVSVASATLDSAFLNGNSVDTVWLSITNDLGDALVVLPTITRVSAGGFTDDVIGALQYDATKKMYWFSYTPGAAVADTVSFTISGASSVATGFVMTSDDKSLKDAYIVDNATIAVLGNSSGMEPGTGGFIGYRYKVSFSEDIGSALLKVDFVADAEDDDDDPISLSIDDDNPDVLDYLFDWKDTDGAVNLTLEIRDKAGNLLSLGTVNLN